MDVMERYNYHIHPFKTITNVFPGKGIRKPMTAKLTKEEVLKCMACGPVYRAFPDRPPVRVTGSNLDNLHRSTLEDDEKVVPSNSTKNIVETSQTKSSITEDTKTEASIEENNNKKQYPYTVTTQTETEDRKFLVETDLIENEKQEKAYLESQQEKNIDKIDPVAIVENIVEDIQKDVLNNAEDSVTTVTNNEVVTINTNGDIIEDIESGDEEIDEEEEENQIIEEGQPLQPVNPNNGKVYSKKKKRH